ncbi:hypothetical protein AYY19_11155 [Photobacterium aquimaris]|uniref:hypothetical protein n=1 Tax=Photobacterium aquimaris TaxID=512643 RepID=UPI0007EFA75A|nr:hypothetical protein [Photobacterium aquimaris]OBU17997.1 hypothetical protein AYY19_11155 [Photobacterium aquimaris]PSW00357.1 hypothetical protein CTM91_12340 [Photobacterium aquimaris]
MRILLASVIFVLLVKIEYMDRELESLVVDRNNVINVNQSNIEKFKFLKEHTKENTNLFLQREQRRVKQHEDYVETTESLNNVLYEKEKYHSDWPDAVIDWLQQPY